MSKWRVTVDLDDPDDYDAGEVRDLVKWALEDNINTEDMAVKAVTVEPREEVAHVRNYERVRRVRRA
jgi:hypothetical protein